MSAAISTASAADERRQIEAAADVYETMSLEDGEESDVAVVMAMAMASDLCKKTLSRAAAVNAFGASGELDERPARSASTSSYQDDEAEGETGEVMAEDPQPTRDLLVKPQEDEGENASEVLERLSFVSLSDKERSSAALMEKPITSDADVSRSIMFTRYARAVPSAQESQPSTTPFGIAGLRLPKAELSVPGAMTIASSGVCPPLLTMFATTPTADPLGCCSVSCQEQSKWKDERVHELQRALDHMVDAMAIQQRDMAAQRAFLARQSEQLTRLSMTLHQEKLSLQIERERIQKAARTAALSPSFTPAFRPPTPSGKAPRSPRGTSKSKASMKAVFSKVAGGSSSSSSSRRDGGRRSTVSSIDEHAVVPPTAMMYSPAPLSVASRSTSASQLAQVTPAASTLDTVITNNPRDTPLHDRSDGDISSTFAMEVERSMPLSALEIRATQPVLTSSSSSNAIKSPPPMSDVSLQDSPVRFGSRSATNCVKTSKERQKEQPASPPSPATVAATSSSTAAASGDSKKPSLGERFRSLRWKS